MAGLIGDSVLVDLQTIVNDSLTDTASNLRTGITTAARVTAELRGFHLQDTPELERYRMWRIMLPNGTDVTLGDRLTIPGKFVYVVIMTFAPASYSVSSAVIAVEAAAVHTLATFTQRVTGLSTPSTYVFIEPMAFDFQILQKGDVLFSHKLFWLESLTYSNGNVIQEGDFVSWTEFTGATPRTGIIHKPTRRGVWGAALIKDSQ